MVGNTGWRKEATQTVVLQDEHFEENCVLPMLGRKNRKGVLGRDNVLVMRTGGLTMALGSAKSWEEATSSSEQMGWGQGRVQDSRSVCDWLLWDTLSEHRSSAPPLGNLTGPRTVHACFYSVRWCPPLPQSWREEFHCFPTRGMPGNADFLCCPVVSCCLG